MWTCNFHLTAANKKAQRHKYHVHIKYFGQMHELSTKLNFVKS